MSFHLSEHFTLPTAVRSADSRSGENKTWGMPDDFAGFSPGVEVAVVTYSTVIKCGDVATSVPGIETR